MEQHNEYLIGKLEEALGEDARVGTLDIRITIASLARGTSGQCARQ